MASVWKLGLFAFKHSALWALGKLNERRASGAGGEVEKNKGKWRERESEEGEVWGVIAPVRVQDREELRGVKKCVENTG